VRRVTRRLTGSDHEQSYDVIAMTLDLVDVVWSAMIDDELYSLADLANSSGQSTPAVARVLGFLTRYGFAERVTKRELIFRKTLNAPPPGDALRILQTLAGGADISDVRKIANVSGRQGRNGPSDKRARQED